MVLNQSIRKCGGDPGLYWWVKQKESKLDVTRHPAGYDDEGISVSRQEGGQDTNLSLGSLTPRCSGRDPGGTCRGDCSRQPETGGQAPLSAGGERAPVCARAAGGGGRRRRRAVRPSAAPRRAPRLGELMAAPQCGHPAERRAQPPAATWGASKMWGDWGGSGRRGARDRGAQQPPLARLC